MLPLKCSNFFKSTLHSCFRVVRSAFFGVLCAWCRSAVRFVFLGVSLGAPKPKQHIPPCHHSTIRHPPTSHKSRCGIKNAKPVRTIQSSKAFSCHSQASFMAFTLDSLRFATHFLECNTYCQSILNTFHSPNLLFPCSVMLSKLNQMCVVFN